MDDRKQNSVIRRHSAWAERKNWIDPKRIFLSYVFVIMPTAEKEIRDIVNLEGTEREEALDKWGKRWNLTAPWCRELALEIIETPWDNASLQTTFSFECPGWDSLRVGEVKAEKDIRAAFEIALKNHLMTMALRAQQHRRLDPAKNRNGAHFIWAVWFQAGKKSHEEIAQTVGVKRRSVEQAVNKILKTVQLSPRTDQPETRLLPGRKPKTGNTQVRE